VEDSGLQSAVEKTDEFLKPQFTVYKTYDMITGSIGACMPMQYHNHFRRFLIVTSGRIHVKITPWKSSKYLHPLTDYENYEFRSLTNVWNSESNKSEKIRADYDRITFEEFDVNAGYVLYIPPYWWYSIQFAETKSVILTATYDSAISMVANTTDLARHFLQLQNNKEIVTRTLIAEPKYIVEKEEEQKEDQPLSPAAEIDTQTLKTSMQKIPTEELYPSGEPYTSPAAKLAEQLMSQSVVPIRDQHEQVMQHILG
jgi:mannose-6-phosphate isomerase-like protein (cupin superfamily)